MTSTFETVIAGVSVFILGQIIIKFILEPILDFRSLLGEITQVFLRHQAEIITANTKEDLTNQLFTFASLLLQKRQAIVLYKYLSRVYGVPKYEDVLDSAKNLNLIANLAGNEKTNKADEQVQIHITMGEIKEKLKINIAYGS